MRSKSLIAGFLATALFLGAACGDDDETGSSSPSSSAAAATTEASASAPASSADSSAPATTAATATTATATQPSGDTGPIKIGFETALSGNTSPGIVAVNQQILGGLQATVDATNAEGGIGGRELEVVVGDDQLDPNIGLTTVRRLVENDEVVALATITGGPTLSAVLPYLDETGMPVVASAAPFMSSMVPVNANVFGALTPYEIQGAVAADFVVNTLGAERPALAVFNDISGLSWGAGFKERLAQLGVEVAAEDAFARGATDFSALIGKLDDAEADVVAFFSSPSEFAAALQAATSRGFEAPWLAGPGNTNTVVYDLVGELASGNYGITPFASLNSTSPEVEAFKSVMSEQAGDVPLSPYTQFGYVTGQILIAALKTIEGPIEPATVRDALEGLDVDAAGLGMFDPQVIDDTNHMFNTGAQIVEFKDGDLVAVGEMIQIDPNEVTPYEEG